jgi:hypothetical protein
MCLPDISGHSTAHSIFLCRCVHGNENQVSFTDSAINVRSEEQVLSTTLLNKLIQSRFVDGQFIRVPSINAGLGNVANSDRNIWALVRNNCATEKLISHQSQIEDQVIL